MPWQHSDNDMAAIKRFFEKRKLDVKFKRAGEGQRLDMDSSTSTSPKHNQASEVPSARIGSDLTREQRMAADAAVARLNQPKAGKKLVWIFRKYRLTFST